MGRQQFSQPINVVSQAGKKVTSLTYNSSTVLAAGVSEVIYVYAPAKTVATVNVLFAKFPAVVAAASGTKVIGVEQNGTIGFGYATGAYNVVMSIDRNIPVGQTTMLPATEQVFQSNIKGAFFDDVIPLSISFTNNTNAATAAGETRNVKVFAMTEVVS